MTNNQNWPHRATDSERLDFVLKNDAFMSRSKTDVGGIAFQLFIQNEDEEYIAISGEDRFFPDERSAIDAAIGALNPESIIEQVGKV